MQYDRLIDGVEHFKAVTLPDAMRIAMGEVDHLLRKVSTTYRGALVIVTPPSKGGQTVAFADLIDVKKVEGGYLWKFANVEEAIEFPASKGKMKGEVWDLYYTEGILMPYPKNARLFLNKNLLNGDR